MKVAIRVEAPAGWKVTSGQGDFLLPAESSTEMRVELDTPRPSEQEAKKAEPQLITVRAEADGKSIGEVKLRVLPRQSALPQ
jgi:hypothetical protein